MTEAFDGGLRRWLPAPCRAGETRCFGGDTVSGRGIEYGLEAIDHDMRVKTIVIMHGG